MKEKVITEEVVKIIKGEDVDEEIMKILQKYPEKEGWVATPSVDAQADGKVKLSVLLKKES